MLNGRLEFLNLSKVLKFSYDNKATFINWTEKGPRLQVYLYKINNNINNKINDNLIEKLECRRNVRKISSVFFQNQILENSSRVVRQIVLDRFNLKLK